MMKRSHGCLYDSQCNYHDHEGAGHRWTSDSDEFGGRWICHQRRNIPHLSHWRARVVSIAGAVNGQDCERGESRSVGDRDTITVVGRHAAPRAERLVINGGACTVQQPGALAVARWTALVDYAIAFSAAVAETVDTAAAGVTDDDDDGGERAHPFRRSSTLAGHSRE